MARKNYGIPYKGSKNLIAEWVVSHVPECGTFIDVFAGGCAITDCILRKGRAKRVIANDRDAAPVKCFEMAVRGEFADEDRWISREAFLLLKDIDPYVRFCFSFGNNAKHYMYSPTIEPYKRATHYATVHGEWADFNRLCPEVCEACRCALDGVSDRKARRIALQRAFTDRIKELSGNNWFDPMVQANPLYRTVKTKTPKRGLVDSNGARLEGYHALQSLESLQSLERLERLQSLQSLQSLELETSTLDYRALTDRILATDGAFVYCDPPYRGTNGYGEFDHDTFLEWALEIGQKRPILISEYRIDHDGFIEVDAKKKLASFSASASKVITEKLYTVKGGVYGAQNDIR